MEAFIRFAELALLDIAGTWQMASPENRQRVQNLLFEGGLHYSKESGILKPLQRFSFQYVGINQERK